MKYLKLAQMKAKLDRSANGIYDLVKEGIIPKPVLLGGQNVWREDLVDKAIAELAAAQGVGWDTLPVAPPSLGAGQ